MSFREHANNATNIADKLTMQTRKTEHNGQKGVFIPEDEASKMYQQSLAISRILSDLADGQERE